MINGNIVFPVPEDSCAVLLTGGAVSRMSRPMDALIEGSSVDKEAFLSALSHQEDGSLPVMLNERILLSTSCSAGEQKLVVMRNPSKVELEEWLETGNEGRAAMLVDGSGAIHAATEAASRLFSGFGMTKLGDFLDQISSTAFLSAASGCLSGRKVKDFSVLTRKGQSSRMSQVMSLRRTGVMGQLMVVSFSSPSMALTSVEQDASRFAGSLFTVIPVPSVRIDGRAMVQEVNGPALTFLPEIRDDGTTSFLDWITEEDRERVLMLHRRKLESYSAPSRFRAGVTMRDGRAGQFEVTSVPMPDRESFLLFLVPEKHLDVSDSDSVPGQLAGELMRILEGFEEGEGSTRTILEFLRAGTGARGASFVSRSRRVTVGDSVPPIMETLTMTLRDPFWTEDRNGHTVTFPVRQRHAQALVRISGMPSDDGEGLPGLVIALAPILAEYLQSGQQLESIVELLSAVSSFLDLLQGRERDVSVVLSEAGAIVGVDYSAIHTVSSREPVLKQLVVFGTTSDPGPLRLEIPSIASWAYTHTETCYVPDTAVDQRFSSVFPSSRSEMAIPLVTGGKTMGTLTVGCTRRDAFGYPVGSLLGILAASLSLWLFRESHAARVQESESRGKAGEVVPGLDDLLLDISHHMKASITTLRGHNDILTSEKAGSLNTDQKESLSLMNEALVGLAEYTDKMLSFLKIELGQEGLETSWTRPSDLVSSMLPLLTEKARARNVTVTAELPSDPFTASFDRARLQQVISHLVDNGIRFNRAGGSVRIEIRMDGTSHWILEVFNTGEGISSEDLPNVFDRFFVGGSRAGGQNLGIGLAIVRSFTRQMGGTVSVRSRQGSGTWFTVRLPVS
ncbi:MAG: hypothetical protein AVO35_01080 [Candidatus Aegiribacteria sp. MLS_C]|nr:MAG: hypothetical protein AVO35_01080 [Candidatus Aegiribacteria sp. MLS_C]